MILSQHSNKKIRDETGLSNGEIRIAREGLKEVILPLNGKYVTCPTCKNKVKLPCLGCVLIKK